MASQRISQKTSIFLEKICTGAEMATRLRHFHRVEWSPHFRDPIKFVESLFILFPHTTRQQHRSVRSRKTCSSHFNKNCLHQRNSDPFDKNSLNQSNHNMMHNRVWIPGLVFSLLLGKTCGDDVGVTICACQPSIYEITLDSALICSDGDVMGPGILTTECLVETRLDEEANVTDFVFQTVSEIQILELDEFQDIISQTLYTDGPYFSGDSITYTSIIRREPDSITAENLPQGIQLLITGVNRLNQPIINFWGILYDNDCGIFPLLTEGQVIGWTEFTDLGDPPLKYCPIAPPTMFPTAAPSVPPPVDDTASPTDSPTESPTFAPTVTPTESPIVSPTLPPDTPTTPVTPVPTATPVTPAPTATPVTPPPVTPAPTGVSAPSCPPVVSWPTGEGKLSGGVGNGNVGTTEGANSSGRGSSTTTKKKKKKDYYYGSMMKTSKKRSATFDSGKGSRGRNPDDDSTYSGRGSDLGDRDLKVGNRPPISPPPSAAPTGCPEPYEPSENRRNLRM